jgi:L-histidine N-alpha-methyltransferase
VDHAGEHLLHGRARSAVTEGPPGPSDRIEVATLSPEVPTRIKLIDDVRRGFARTPKELPPKYFYDVDGCGLFEKITELPEYYVTRVETEVLERGAREMVSAQGSRRLAELGSGSSRKTRALIEAMFDGVAEGEQVTYAPFDISESALRDAAADLTGRYPALRVEGYVGDFLTDDLDEMLKRAEEPQLLAFLGSTLGNLDAAQRRVLFGSIADATGDGDGLLLGVDLAKDASIIEPAYNDAAGVTAEFNLNVLRVLQKELGATVDVADFEHDAPYVVDKQRIEMRLYATRDVEIDFERADLPTYRLANGEYLLTELSQKFSQDALEQELATAGLAVRRWWADDRGWVAVALITHA